MNTKPTHRLFASENVATCFAIALLSLAATRGNVRAAGADAAVAKPAGDPIQAVEQWLTSRGNPAGSGCVPQTLAKDLAEQWRYDVQEAVEATPIVDQRNVYIADVEGTLYALDRREGTLRWKTSIDGGFLAAAAVQGKTLVIGDYNGVAHAFETDTGKLLWEFETDGEISAGVAFYKDSVLVPSQDGSLYRLKLDDGKVVWKYETDDQIQCSPTIAGNRTFLGGCDGNLHAVDLESGQAAADPLPLGGPTLSTPAVINDRAFLTTHGGLVIAFNWKEHRELWQFSDADRQQEYRSSPAACPQAIVVASQFRKVTALDPDKGTELWSRPLRRFADGGPVIAGDDVWIASSDGRLLRLALKDGAILWEREFRGSFVASPVVAGQQLFVVNDDGVVICFGPAAAKG